MPKKMIDPESFPQAAAMWHAEKNAPRLITDYKPGSHIKVWWRCDAGHSWQASVFSVTLGGCGCPYCNKMRALPGETDLVTTNPEIAAQWDYEKNGELSPNNVLPASHEKIWWRCELGHSWQAAPFSRTKEKGTGCPYCSGKKVLAGFNDLVSRQPQIAAEWYQPLNGELLPSHVTPGCNKKVWWRCNNHHVWQACVYARTKKNGTGCPVCANVAKTRKIRYFESPPKPAAVKAQPAVKHDNNQPLAM